jgi:glycine betaine/proline transport system substrate-binding protein
MAVMEAQASAVTAKDVQAAVMEAQASAVTAEEVQAAVQKAADSAAMQVAENSLTAEEIESIVSMALEERAMMEEVPRETIIFSDLNWTSAQVQNRVAQYIVENGYGYPTDQVLGATLPNFQGLQRGDIHVTLEIWLPNQSLGWGKAVEIGDVVSVGTSLVGDWQSTFVVPKYVADAYPDLKTPQDLLKPEFQELFATDDSRGKARHVACLIGWSCELVNTAQIESYGLVDNLHVINPGSQEAMFADLYAAYENERPWLGYMWGTGDPALKLDLVRLEEEPYSEECWEADKACAFADSLVLVAVHKSLLPRAPDVIAMLQNWEFTVPIYKSIFQYLDANEGSEARDGAIWFLNNKKVWESWVTPEAAAAVNAALADEG